MELHQSCSHFLCEKIFFKTWLGEEFGKDSLQIFKSLLLPHYIFKSTFSIWFLFFFFLYTYEAVFAENQMMQDKLLSSFMVHCSSLDFLPTVFPIKNLHL